MNQRLIVGSFGFCMMMMSCGLLDFATQGGISSPLASDPSCINEACACTGAHCECGVETCSCDVAEHPDCFSIAFNSVSRWL